MTIPARSFWNSLRPRGRGVAQTRLPPPPQASKGPSFQSVRIADDDPILAYFQAAPRVVEIDQLDFDSPALRALKSAGVKIAAPLVSQGELIGLLNLGPRLSEQEYSADDRALLNNLASQAAPAVRVAELVRQQQGEVQARERLNHELRVARLIQQTLLPKELPALAGYHVAAYYQPASAVGGDFYDFFNLPDGRLGLVIGDVSDKGVPAALVMATTRSILRSAAQQTATPGQALEQTNEMLCPDIPPKIFVTCLYAILDPASGRLAYANAGHDLPYRRLYPAGVSELRARGMPLGLMPGMHYEEKETVLGQGESILFYSDGLVEAHNPQRQMFSFPRLGRLVAEHQGGAELIDFLLDELAQFTGPKWEQEDDVTLVTLERTGDGPILGGEGGGGWRILAEFSVASKTGNERLALQGAAKAAEGYLPPDRIERLKTAVGEGTMNAIEHGNKSRPELPVLIQVSASETVLSIRITDQGGSGPIPDAQVPDLEAKLEGLQSPRGWGLFLIKNLVDEMHFVRDEAHHTLELIFYREGERHGDPGA